VERAGGEERIAEASPHAPTAAEMHGLIAEVLGYERGEIAHSSDAA
jgi:hypothetical protein